MLIASPRHRRADLVAWEERAAMDLAYARTCSARLERLADRARDEMAAFARGGPCFVSTSWGKDSTVLAHLAVGTGLPLVWFSRPVPGRAVSVEPFPTIVDNPDCRLVRDAFMARRDAADVDYHEVWATGDPSMFGAIYRDWADQFGNRRITGLRADESKVRGLSIAGGLSTGRSCRPLGHWDIRDVFGYLALHDLPVHPAYACTFGGTHPRELVRVGGIGGERGRSNGGRGREHWERTYYSDVLHQIAGAS